MDMFKSKNYYILWTVSMCTTSLHSKFCKIVLWHECTRLIWMDYLLQNICLSCRPGFNTSYYNYKASLLALLRACMTASSSGICSLVNDWDWCFWKFSDKKWCWIIWYRCLTNWTWCKIKELMEQLLNDIFMTYLWHWATLPCNLSQVANYQSRVGSILSNTSELQGLFFGES